MQEAKQSEFRFVRIGAKRHDRTAWTVRVFGKANAPSVVLQQMAKPYAYLSRYQRREIEFDLVRVAILCESESLREAHHVGVDADGLSPESVAKQDIGCLSSYAGKSKKVVELVGDFAIEAFDDFAAAVVNRLCFIAIKVDFVDLALQLRQRLASVVCRGPVFLEKFDRHSVHEIVPGLRCQYQSDEQFQGIGKIQVKLGVGMGFFQPRDNLLHPAFFLTRV